MSNTVVRPISNGVQVRPLAGQGPAGPAGPAGPSLISDTTALGTLTGADADAAFVMASNAAGTFARKISLGATGRSLLGSATAAAARTLLGLGSAALASAGDFDAAGTASSLVSSLSSSLKPVAFSGAYSSLTGLPALGTLAALNAAPAGTLTGTTLAANVVTTSITTLGTLTGLAVGSSSYTGQVTIDQAAGTNLQFSVRAGGYTSTLNSSNGVLDLTARSDQGYARFLASNTVGLLFGANTDSSGGGSSIQFAAGTLAIDGGTAVSVTETYQAKSSTTPRRPAARFICGLGVDSTDATRAGRVQIGSYYTTTWQEGLRIDANSGGARLGFFGGAAAAKPTVSGTGVAASLNSLLSELASLGLVTNSALPLTNVFPISGFYIKDFAAETFPVFTTPQAYTLDTLKDAFVGTGTSVIVLFKKNGTMVASATVTATKADYSLGSIAFAVSDALSIEFTTLTGSPTKFQGTIWGTR